MTPPIPARPALFLDVDGTLLPIAARPEAVRPDAALLLLLERVMAVLEGAVALLSGRTLATLMNLFDPLPIPIAGTHGLEVLFETGDIRRLGATPAISPGIRAALELLVEADPGLYLEDKGSVLAVHYRHAPARAAELRRELERLRQFLGPEYQVQQGLYVLELKPAGVNKGTALRLFMESPTFSGRIPVAVGDDLTDLHAFRQAELFGGCGVAVGDRIGARWRISDPATLHQWLEDVIQEVGAASCADRRP